MITRLISYMHIYINSNQKKGVVMAGPYTCNSMTVKVQGAGDTEKTLGVVVGLDIELSKEGGVQHRYGSVTGKHVRGGEKATFRAQRWYMSDADTDLLFDLFNDDIEFSLTGEIAGHAGSELYLNSCMGYRYRLITGDANSVVGEEVSGEATSWEGTNIL